MAELDQTSTPQYKRCPKCGEIKARAEFFKSKNRPGGWSSWCKICLSDYSKSDKARQSQKKYRESDKRKISKYKYNHSEKGHLTRLKNHKIWMKTDKGKASRRRYAHSDNGSIKLRIREYHRNMTLKRQHWKKQYESTTEFKEKRREWKYNWYHEAQDRFGCHSDVNDWYPAARLIEALETAPIVEIKG